jgi:two-component system, OmpR family, phosphate regulon sensor histidine kinase PhoR
VEQATCSKPVRARLFWRLGLTYVALLVAVLIAVDLYSARVIRSQAIRSANSQLTSLLNVAQTRPPHTADAGDLRTWTEWMAKSGARVTIIDSTGRVLADSAAEASQMENHANRPEIQQAIATGRGQAVHHSVTLDRELVYQAVRYQEADGQPIIIRLAVPLSEINLSVSELRQRLLVASIVMLLIGAIASLGFARMFAARIERLKDFSQRIAEGNFRPLLREGPRDELSDLADSMNQTAARLDLEIRMLSGERNRSSAILRSMVEGVAVIDAEERLVFYNRAFSEIFGVQSATAEGRTLIEVVRNAELVGLIRKALRGEEGLQNDISMGIVQMQSFSVTAAPVKALDAARGDHDLAVAKPSGAVVVLHDVTELRRLERVRQDFVANVSHEFKTPLTAIQGFAETLLSGALHDPANNRRFLDIIRNHAIRLARLTDDLLKLARIEAGKLEVEFFPVGLMELIEGCAETTLLKASRKQITLEIEVPSGLPPVRGDAGLLRDVLQNLLDNAIQYTPAGGHIHVTAAAQGREAVINVSDTGIGIPTSDRERIFERFYRVDAARSREAGGTGLGLSIAKHIVEAHNGRLSVDSVIGEGSKFSFSVPIAS